MLAANASYPTITLTVDVANNAPNQVTNSATVSGGGDSTPSTDNDPTTVLSTNLAITKSHTGDFTQGQSGATYTIGVTNNGPDPTDGQVSVVDALPTGLPATAISGTGWTCVLGTLTCTRSDVLAANASYPNITLTVDVANNARPRSSRALRSPVAAIRLPARPTIRPRSSRLTSQSTSPHTSDFTQGQTGAIYTRMP